MLDEPVIGERGADATQDYAAGKPVAQEVIHGEEDELCDGKSGAQAGDAPCGGAHEQEADLH